MAKLRILAARKTVSDGLLLGVSNIGHGEYEILVAPEEFFKTYQPTGQEAKKVARLAARTSLAPKVLGKGILTSARNMDFYCLHTEAIDGYGPVLYDAGLIIAAKRGKSVIPSVIGNDFWTTSESAEAVWTYYYKNRTDVVKTELPDEIKKAVLEKRKWDKSVLTTKPWLFYSYSLKKRLSSLGPIWSGSKL